MNFGAQRMIEDLKALNLVGELVVDGDKADYVVVRGFLIELGKFAGRTIDLAIPAPSNFPQGVASAIHIRANPQLYEISDSISQVRNIVASKLGGEWRYWSKTFTWNEGRTTRNLLSQINEIFLHS